VVLTSVEIRALRNIDHILFEADPGINWLVGRNGAGKTSILEAIFLLARGQSFRGRRHGPLVKVGERGLRIQGGVSGGRDGGSPTCIQFRQSGVGPGRFSENGLMLEGISGLRNRVHVRMIADNAQRLLEGEPQIRRLFLDWNLFHVEQDYREHLRQFRRIQAQRAAWLRGGGKGRPVWDNAYVELGEALTARRADAISRLQQHCVAIQRDLPEAPAFHLLFSRGWPDGKDLADLLDAGREADLQRGYTFYGPARADFRLKLADQPGSPSRGQAKLVVCVLQVGAQRMWYSAKGPQCIWLLDDVTSELDRNGAEAVVTLFQGAGGQIFATSVDGDSIGRSTFSSRAGALFHVEHGAISDSAAARS